MIPTLDAETLKTWHRRYFAEMDKPGHGTERTYTLDQVRRVALVRELAAYGVPAGAAANIVAACNVDGLGHQSWMDPDYRPRLLLAVRRNPDGTATYKPTLPFGDEFRPDARACIVLDLGAFLGALDSEIGRVIGGAVAP